MKKRFLAALLALCMVFALGTVSALATDGETSTESTGAVLYNGVAYDTLADAVAVIHQLTGTERMKEHVIQLTDDVKFGGFAAGYDTISNGTTNGNSPVNITVNLGGRTYTVTDPTVGSSGTETNGFQFLKGSKVTFKNGKIVSSLGTLLFQNYCDLTFNNVDITATNASYVISNNCGEMNLLGNSSITAGAGNKAFDVCWWPASYSEGVDVTIDTTGTITGNIELGTYGTIDENTNANNTLTIENVVFNGEIVATQDMTSQAKNIVTITGGNFSNSESAKDYLAPGLEIGENGNVEISDDAVARVGDTVYTDLQKAIDAANAGDKVELLNDVPLTAELSITKNITIDGNGKKLTLTAAANSQGLSIGKSETPSTVTLDDVKLTITGTQNTSADGIDVWGTLNLKNSSVSMSDLRSAFVMQGGASAKLNINNSTVNVKDITGNGTNGGYVVIDDSNVTFDRVGSHGLSVEEVTVTDSSLSFTDVAYCALYGQEIVLDSGADVEIKDCGTGLPRDGWGGVKYQAPVQVKVVAGHDDNGITVKSGASLIVTGTNDEIYIPKGTGFVSNGYVSADIVLGDTDMSVVTFVKNSTRQIKLVEDGKEIKLPDPGKYLGREFVGWECSLNDRVYPEGYEYKVTRDVTFTAVWEAAAYDIVIDDDILHGDIWTSPKSEAEAGDTVYVYADPDAGYVLADLSVTYRSGRNELKLTRVSANHYTFTMPAYDVYVTAEFTSDGFPFDDVRSNQWFYDAVYYVWANDLMEGVDYDEFNPNGTMTRAMFWAVLGRIDGETITGSDWADEARDWAMSEGVSDGTNPNGLVTREQMVTMLWRYAGERDGSGNLSRYTDGDKVAQYATEAMRWALGNGIIEGTTATTLEPQATATRAQCAAIFMRYYE